MTIYVDEIRNWGKRGEWCHMMTDGDMEELHRMATKIGLKRSWFQGQNVRHPHYDLRPSKRMLAIKAGAVPVSSAELLQRCTVHEPALVGPVGDDKEIGNPNRHALGSEKIEELS